MRSEYILLINTYSELQLAMICSPSFCLIQEMPIVGYRLLPFHVTEVRSTARSKREKEIIIASSSIIITITIIIIIITKM